MSSYAVPSLSRELFPWLAFALLMLLLAAAGPLPLPAHYHEFADGRTVFGLPNALNVLSNLGFFGVGLWGLTVARRLPASSARVSWQVFSAAVLATAIGSGWYHLAPDDVRIDWDRLPIALACAGMIGAVVSELLKLGRRRATILLAGLSAYAALAVFCVPMLARYGVGDLRLYLTIQLASMVLIPLLQWAYRVAREERMAFGVAVACYMLAKLAEVEDRVIFDSVGLFSGHTLKHLLATLACGVVVWALHKRCVHGRLTSPRG